MIKKILLTASIVSLVVLAAIVGQANWRVEANFLPMQPPQPAITIQNDGTINPISSPITHTGNTYTLTGNITGYTLVVDRDNTVIDGANYALQGNNNTAGVFVQGHSGVTIQNLNIQGFTYGVIFTWLSYGSSAAPTANSITNDTLSDNAYGIYISDFSQGNSIVGNTLTDNTYGIYLSSTSNNVLRNNHMENNNFNFFVYASSSGAANDVDTSNTVDDKPIIYWLNQQNRQVPNDAGYIVLVNCSEIVIQGFNLSHNGQAILLVNVTDSIITGNTLVSNENAIWLVNSKSVSLTQNIFVDNPLDAIYMISTNDSLITANTFVGNGHEGTPASEALGNAGQGCIWLSSSSNNTISENTMTNNGEGVDLQYSDGNLLTTNQVTKNSGTAIELYSCTQNNITGNTVAGNALNGATLWSSNNNTVQSNTISNNTIGILLDEASENSISENTIANSTQWGMQLKSSGDTFGQSESNVVLFNNFINDENNGSLDVSIPGVLAYPNGMVPGLSNVWDDGHQGNYWSNYTERYQNASEIPSAGIWDQAWVINENNIDHCPLIEPYTSTSTQNVSPTPSISPSQLPASSETILPTQSPQATPPPSVQPTKTSEQQPQKESYFIIIVAGITAVALISIAAALLRYYRKRN